MTAGNVLNLLFEQESSQNQRVVGKKEIEEMIKNGAEVIEFQTLVKSIRTTKVVCDGKIYICEHGSPLGLMLFPGSVSDGKTFYKHLKTEGVPHE